MTANRAQHDAEAWRWVVRMDAGDWSEADEAALQAWIEADPKHRGALLEAEALWTALDDAGVPDSRSESQRRAEGEPGHRSTWLSRRRLIAGGGAALAASFAGALFLAGGTRSYRTAVGEIRQIPLADGSVAAINTASRIEISFAQTRREVRLDHGEVWFQVSRDTARPFIVEAGNVRVRAVGTAFSVRRRDNGADVLVTEGVVEAWAEGHDSQRIRLGAGQQVFLTDDAVVTSAATEIAAVDRKLAWRGGRVDFVNEPIANAAAEFNRYNRRQLVILDPAIGREQFDGVFRTDDPESFARAVSASLGVDVDLSGDSEIRIGGDR